jgi:glyoxylase-like metal-dependent hydrolase (beta-lactamase superfamily II)
MIGDQSLSDDSASEFRGLLYPYGRWFPGPAELKQVAEGVFWLRMPLPFSLDHINLYVLDDGDGWALVDTGVNMPACKELWEQLFAGALAGRPVTRVLVTHYHPDHLGLAGWLCERFGVELWIARTEFLYAQYLCLDKRDTAPDEVCSFYARAGWSAQAVETLRGRGWGNFGKGVARLPSGYVRMQDGDQIRIGGRLWRCVTGRGHAPEHICLVCDEAGVMISGDQVLPRITSNVSVYPTEPHGNPLRDWLESLDTLQTLDDRLFVLPAHNEPFYQLHKRCQALAADHHSKLERLVGHCATPRTVVGCFEALFKRPIGPDEIMMATGESLAHLHYLESAGLVKRDRQAQIDLFSAC